jgi:two-component system, cell cycle response regulator DivK
MTGRVGAPSVPKGSASNVLTVVYIEDNQANLDLVTRILESTGQYRVVGVVDGQAGLGVIERERPALVLVDLDVPSVNGFEIARRLKASPDPQVAAIPVAVVTANVLKNEQEAAMAAGCAAFIEKPFDIHEFRREVARILAASGRAP